jgi:hypothetical protein
MSKFKVGDKIRRVQPSYELVVGEVYTVSSLPSHRPDELYVEGEDCIYSASNFELFEPVVVYEIGKTYSFLNSVLTCIAFTSKGLPVFEREDGTVFEKDGGIDFKEIVKPKSGKVWLNIYDNHVFDYPDKEDANRSASSDRLACVEVNWTEGEGI